MPQQTRTRRQNSVTLNTFSTKTVTQLGRGMIYREIYLRFYGTFTYAAAANNAVATLGRGDEWSAIARIDLVVNGTDIIRSFTGTQLVMFNRFMYGTYCRPSVQLGDAATAGPAFDSTLILPLWQPLSAKPMDTALDSSKVSDLRLEITTNSSANINSANGPTAIAATLDVTSYESFGVELEASDCRMYALQSTLAAANPNLQIQLPVTCMYRGFLINAASTASETGTDQVANITNVKLVSGTTVFRDMPFVPLRSVHRQRLGFGQDLVQNVAAGPAISNATQTYLKGRKSGLHDEDAWAFMNLCEDGYLGESIDSLGFSELYLEVSATLAGTITVIPIQIFPRRKAA